MEKAEVLGLKAAAVEQGYGQTISHHLRQRDARGRRQVHRTGFAHRPGHQRHLTAPREHRSRRGNDRDERNPVTLEVGKQRNQLFAATALGEEDGHVAGREQPGVAVQRVPGMEEYGRCSGARQRGRQLVSDVPLAQPSYAAIQNFCLCEIASSNR